MPYTPNQLHTAQQIVDEVQSMEQLCADLKQELLGGAVIQSRCYSLPRTLREDESKAVDRIEATPISGSQGLRLCLDALSDWYGHPEFSTKVVNRTPGALVVASVNEDRILKLVAAINRSKATIETLMPSLGTRDDRFELLHRHLPWVILTQLTRNLLVVPSSTPLQSCTFTWGIKTEIKIVSRDEVCNWLDRRRQRPRPTLDDVSWDVKIDREITAIQSLPASAELRWRRVLRVRPLANLRFYSIDGESPETYLREAHTPILILNPSRRVKVGVLRGYTAAERLGRERSKDRGDYERVIDLFPIYLRKASGN